MGYAVVEIAAPKGSYRRSMFLQLGTFYRYQGPPPSNSTVAQQHKWKFAPSQSSVVKLAAFWIAWRSPKAIVRKARCPTSSGTLWISQTPVYEFRSPLSLTFSARDPSKTRRRESRASRGTEKGLHAIVYLGFTFYDKLVSTDVCFAIELPPLPLREWFGLADSKESSAQALHVIGYQCLVDAFFQVFDPTRDDQTSFGAAPPPAGLVSMAAEIPETLPAAVTVTVTVTMTEEQNLNFSFQLQQKSKNLRSLARH
ncbi:hypothetical protein BDZ45DRAFT_740621 [Acephala macrosclerotiorum]|nr:hypothetical protein BDZ45DRAFT_740621 [Acephala macrosclerotiorum]